MPQDRTPRRASALWTLSAISAAMLLTACGGGGGGSDGGGGVTTQSIGGGGVKGPLANAVVTAYAFDATKAGFKGTVIDTGSTGSDAKIVGLSLTLPLTPPYILEFTSDAGTTDITTGKVPVITTMRTVLTQALLDTNEDVYATPLTTMATDLAVANADSASAPFTGNGDGTTTSAEFVAALPVAASQVTSTLGFGLDSAVDIFDTPPLVDDTTDTADDQTNVAAYRAAVEAVTAVVYEMDSQSTGTTPDSVLAEIAADLANDGLINGTTAAGTSAVLTTTTLAVLDQDPALLPIPNTDDGTGTEILVGAVEKLLNDEKATTGNKTDTSKLTDGSIDTVVAPAAKNPDIDGDGVMNANDAFPTDASESLDTDGDGIGNKADMDDDNDGALDAADAFPLDASEQVDTDGDGTGNNADTDDDDDGVLDSADDFPLDATASSATDADGDGWPVGQDSDDADKSVPAVAYVDTDGDGFANDGGMAPDADDDNDGVLDAADAFPLDASEQLDTDGDGTGNNADSDDDGDTVKDSADAFPLDATESVDTDRDGKGNNIDTDDDGDGILDTQEAADGTNPLKRDSDGDGIFDNRDAFPNNASEAMDTDGDCGTTPLFGATDGNSCGNNSDTDADGDGLSNAAEITAGTKPLVADTDGDMTNDGADAFPLDSSETMDSDKDGVGDNADAFPMDATETADSDNDTIGDNAETAAGTNPNKADSDGDGVNDNIDVFPLMASETLDSDGDGMGDNADAFPNNAAETADSDGDGVGNNADVFPNNAAESVDTDGDGVGNNGDNCLMVANSDQADSDGNGVGDACQAAAVIPVSGAYGLAFTTTSQTATTEPEANWCYDPSELNTTLNRYIPIKVSGNTLTIDGDIVGTVAADGSFTASVTTNQSRDFNGTDVTVTDVENLTGTVSAAGIAGTYAGTQTSTGSVTVDCAETGAFSTTLSYAPTGSEDYSSVYAIEVNLNGWDEARQMDISKQSPFAAQMLFDRTAGTLKVYDGESQTTASSYDPASGAFSTTLVSEDSYDANEDGNNDLVRSSVMLSGVMIRAPGSAQAEMWLDRVESEDLIYYGDATGIPTYTGQAADQRDWDSSGEGYAKMVATSGFNRAVTNPVSNGSGTKDNDFLGLKHPPLMTASADSMLYFEAFAGTTATGTPLCSVSYEDRMQWREQMPRPNMSMMAILSTPYSHVNCPLTAGTVTAGSDYTLTVRDDNGTPTDASDDIQVTSMAYTAAAVGAYPGVKQARRSLSLNGMTSSQTESGKFLMMSGFYNPGQVLPISWPAVTGADQYSIKLWNFDPWTSKRDDTQLRMSTSTSSLTLPAMSLQGQMIMRLQARYPDSGGNAAYSQSKLLKLMPGINGLVNVELADAATGGFERFQMDLRSDETGGVYCGVPAPQSVNCTYTANAIDWSSNTVSLDMVDNTGDLSGAAGSNFTLVMQFSDAGNASATPSVGGMTGVARVVNTELVAMNRMRANGLKSTQLVLRNPVPSYNVGTIGTKSGSTALDAAGAISVIAWDNTLGAALMDVMGSFYALPIGNGAAQKVGGYVSYDSKDAGFTGLSRQLGSDTYTFALSDHMAGLPGRSFKAAYTAADPTGIVGGPVNTAITYDSTAVAAGIGDTPATSIQVAAGSLFTLSWNSALPADTQMQVMVQLLDGSGIVVPHADIRSGILSAASSSELSVTGSAWSWDNSVSGLDLDGIMSSGEVARIIIVSFSPDGSMRGTSEPFYVTKP